MPAELYIDRGNKEENETILDQLYSAREQIESEVGMNLEWERLDAKRACRIKWQNAGNIFDRDQWPEMISFMVSAMLRFEQVLKPRLQAAAIKLA